MTFAGKAKSAIVGGSNLSHPQPTPKWIIGALVGVALLVCVWFAVIWAKDKLVPSASSAVNTVSQATNAASGTIAGAWDY